MGAKPIAQGNEPLSMSASSITFDPKTRRVTIQWADGHKSRFPFIWLRHQHFFPSMGRPDQPKDIPHLIPEDPETPTIAGIQLRNDQLEISWSHDGSRTSHELAFLRQHCISEAERDRRRPKAIMWGREDAANFRWFAADDLNRPESLLAVFEHLMLYGIVFVKETTVTPGSLIEIGKLFGPIRRSHFGELFDIRSTPGDNAGVGANIGATAHNAQAPHADDGFRHGIIGINFFQSLKAHDFREGKSVFVDGFKVADALRHADREAYSFLSSVPLQFTAERNPDERFRTMRRVITTDSAGIVRGVTVSDRTFPPMNLPEEQIEPAYRSLRAFCRELAKDEYAHEVLLKAGDLAIFDNHRVLHSRTAFDPTTSSRHIQQISVDREEYHNSMRRLAERCGRWDLANLDTDAGALSQR